MAITFPLKKGDPTGEPPEKPMTRADDGTTSMDTSSDTTMDTPATPKDAETNAAEKDTAKKPTNNETTTCPNQLRDLQVCLGNVHEAYSEEYGSPSLQAKHVQRNGLPWDRTSSPGLPIRGFLQPEVLFPVEAPSLRGFQTSQACIQQSR